MDIVEQSYSTQERIDQRLDTTESAEPMRLRGMLGRVRIAQNLAFLRSTYVYRPLPLATCVRLLELVPSPDKNRIRCSLKTFELGQAPSFKALSYTWGNSETTIKKSSTLAKEAKSRDSAHSGPAGSWNRYLVDLETMSLTRRYNIICDDRLLRVTGNLRNALYMLANSTSMPAMPKTPTYYWIDAICVDQKNISERNVQVARMADIFRRADGVVAWLGNEDKFTADALTVVRTISEMPEAEWPLVPYTAFYDPGENRYSHHSSLSFYHWLGFIVLINRPWFRRAWVVQEIVLGKSPIVVCGSKVFPWEDLSRTLSFIKTTRWYHHLQTEKLKQLAALQKCPGIYKRVLQSKLSVGISPVFLNETRQLLSATATLLRSDKIQKPPLLMLLDKHRFTESTDPRDKVYAFLGLAARSMAPFRTQPTALIPNYNLSVQNVYLETAIVLMKAHKNLYVLSNVEDPSRRRIQGLPSWVADYSVSLDPYPLRFRGPGQWRASGDGTWEMNTQSMENGLLEVQDYQLSYIDQCSVLLDESSDPSASWASIVKLALCLDNPYPGHAGDRLAPSRVEILWRTLTTDTYAHTYPAPPAAGSLFVDYILNLQIRHRLMPWAGKDAFQPHHSPLSESIYPEWRTLLSLEPPHSPFCIAKYKERLTTVVESMFNGTYSPIGLAQLQHELDQSGGKKRRLFKTRSGHLGTGPRSLQQGDEVWILNGGGLPFVLRPLPNGRYRLIGEAFVYGVMHGGAPLRMGLQLREITIE